MDIFTDAQWQIAYLHCRVFCTLSIRETAGSDILSKIYRECFTCMSAFNTVVSRMNRQTCSCACAKGLCVPHVPISRSSQKSAQKRPFCQQLCLCTLSTPPSVPWNAERFGMISTKPKRRNTQICITEFEERVVQMILGSGVTYRNWNEIEMYI